MPEDTLVAHLRRVGRDLDTGADVRDHQAALARLVATAVAAVPGTHTCGLTLAGDRYRSALDASSGGVPPPPPRAA